MYATTDAEYKERMELMLHRSVLHLNGLAPPPRTLLLVKPESPSPLHTPSRVGRAHLAAANAREGGAAPFAAPVREGGVALFAAPARQGGPALSATPTCEGGASLSAPARQGGAPLAAARAQCDRQNTRSPSALSQRWWQRQLFVVLERHNSA